MNINRKIYFPSKDLVAFKTLVNSNISIENYLIKVSVRYPVEDSIWRHPFIKRIFNDYEY